MSNPDASSCPAPRCPDCGAALTASRLEGLCPLCLLDETPLPGAAGGDPATGGLSLMHLSGYRLIREIARGGMGIIYEAVQDTPSRSVAIKMLLPHLMEEPAMRERFRREAQAMAGLDHPGILPIYEVGDHNGLPYFSMKLAAAGTLTGQAWRYRDNWRAISGLIAELADAIHTAHTHGVLHRDLKPANILFDEQRRTYISDFGIAKQLDADPAGLDLTKSATLLGTPNYLPPEWAGGTARRATTAGDLYGLGAIFYQLLTGDPPHQAAQLTTLLRQIADEPVTPPRQIDRNIPQDLEIICLKAISKDPADRYVTALALAEDLRLWLQGRPIKARPASLTEKFRRWGRRNPLPATLAAGLAGALVFGGSALWLSLRTSRQNLHDSLIAQAGALRETGRLGNRTQSVAALQQAIGLKASDAARNELSSALAMADLQEVNRFPYGSAERVYTDAFFTRYSYLDEQGHMKVRRLQDHTILSQVPGEFRDLDAYGPMSPDGRFIVLRPLKNKPFSIWDGTSQTIRLRDVCGRYLLFGPDSRLLAIGDENGTLTLMDMISGEVRQRFTTQLKPVRPYSFSPDGTKLVAGQFKSSRFGVFETDSGRVIMQEELPPAARVRSAVWRPSGDGFFIGTESFKIYEWSLTVNSLPRQYTGHQGNILALAIHPSGEWLVSQSQDGTTRLWNTASARSVAELPFFGAEVKFSQDGRRLLCEDRDVRQLHLMDLIPSSVCRQFSVPHSDPDQLGTRGCWFITFSPDGGLLSVGDSDGILHFDGITGAYAGAASRGYCWGLGWAADGSRLYSVGRDGLQQWTTLTHFFPGRRSPSVRLTPPGLTVGLESPAVLEHGLPSPQRTFLPAMTLARDLPTVPMVAPGLNHLAVSGDGATVAMAFDRRVGLYRAATGEPIGHLPAVTPLLDTLALNQDGSLAAASQQRTGGVPVWDTVRRHRIALLPTRFAEASVRFHPDGQRIFTGDLEVLTCWEARSARILWQVPCPARSSLAVQLALTLDGTLLAANLSASILTLFDSATGREITRLQHPTPVAITGIAFSPDQSRLAALCVGHLVQLWDLRSLRRELVRHSIDWPLQALPPICTPWEWTIPPHRIP